MKKIIVAILIVAFAAGMTACGVVKQVGDGKTPVFAEKYDYYGMLAHFVENYPDRTSGGGEEKVTDYIASVFDGYGLEPYKGGKKKFVYRNPLHNDGVEQSYNVQYIKSSAVENAQSVVVGAHYDNLYSYKTEQGGMLSSEGANDNAAGVVALLSVARLLKDVQLPFNVIFCAFGAEEPGLFGSNYFVDELADDKNNILMMINLQSIVGGDYTYIYSDEVETMHGEYIYTAAADAGLPFTPVPKYKKQTSMLKTHNVDSPYLHAGMLSDHMAFMQNGINVLHYTAMNWSDMSVPFTSEMKGKPNYNDTTHDTLANLESRVGGKDAVNARIAMVVTSVYNALTDKKFTTTANESYANAVDYSFVADDTNMTIVNLAVRAAIIIALAVIMSVLSKKLPVQNRAAMINDAINAASAPPPEPINPFDDDDKAGGNGLKRSSDDDIFD